MTHAVLPLAAPLPAWASGGIAYLGDGGTRTASAALPHDLPGGCSRVLADGPGLAGGLLLHGAAGARPVVRDGRRIGSTWTDACGRWLHLAGLGGGDPAAPPAIQAERCYDRFAEALAGGGFCLGEVVRTWFQLDRILDWYADFNRVRSRRLAGQAAAAAPASTAVGGRAGDGGAISLAALALQPAPGVQVRTLDSPLQGPAPAYGSRFSRAVRVDGPHGAWISVSGTASIAADGRTLHVGDAAGQIDRTLAVIEALLAAEGCGWPAVTGAALYVSPGADPAACLDRVRRRLGATPLIASVQQVCRSDLLVEIELDARIGRTAVEG